MKTLTWETANQASNKYDLVEYLNRAYSWTHDPAALLYSCLVRFEINNSRRKYLRKIGGNADSVGDYQFLRVGSKWLRNEEFQSSGSVRTSTAERLFRHSYGISSNYTAQIPYNPTHWTEATGSGLFLDYYDKDN